MAASINAPNSEGRAMIRCINPGEQPCVLKAGRVIGSYTSIDDTDNGTDMELGGQVDRQTRNSDDISGCDMIHA